MGRDAAGDVVGASFSESVPSCGRLVDGSIVKCTEDRGEVVGLVLTELEDDEDVTLAAR